MVRIEKLQVSFNGTPILSDLDAMIEKGEHAVFTGKSGIGKTTLFNVLLGFVPYQHGSVYVMGMPVTKENIQEIRKNVAYIPQEISLPYEKTRDVFFEPFTFKQNRKNRPNPEELTHLFQTIGLPTDILDRNIDELSGGQKQRILLASAFLQYKPLILLDEPTSGLDEENIEHIAEWLNHQRDITILSTSHHRKWIHYADKSINLQDYGTNH
jgi:ABC-type multidrug transport system ATPase subunit